jgi:predicted GNAT superfamily acetyltransferase
MDVQISVPENMEQFKMIEWLQAEIWGSVADAVPAHLLLTIAKEGGVVILATHRDQPVGFAYGFPAVTGDGQLKLASHQAGILPAYQDRGWGRRLKQAQRGFAIERGFELMTWTFDPLQGRNARLNLHVLGAVCNTYVVNLYGDLADKLNHGMPTDRFRVDWWLKSAHVERRLSGKLQGDISVGTDNCPVFALPTLPGEAVEDQLSSATMANVTRCLVKMPGDLSKLKSEAPAQALEWRFYTRALFIRLFEAGFVAIDLVREGQQNYYLLQRE